MFVVDTNVLIYAADRDSPDHEICRELLESFRASVTPWYLTWGIVYEFLRVVTHPKVMKIPLTTDQAWRFLNALFDSPRLGILSETDRHRYVASMVFEELPEIKGNLVFDARTAILMKENGIRRIYTRDSDFDKFPFIERVDPGREEPA